MNSYLLSYEKQTLVVAIVAKLSAQLSNVFIKLA